MVNVVKHKRSSTSGETPSASDLDVGEIAVNTADGKLFVKHTDGTVVEISGGGGGGSVSTLSDTTITSLGDGELLVYDTTSSKWINQTLSEAGIAALASPGLTGTPTAPTASAATNSTQIATTAYVTTAVSNLVDSAPGALNTLNELAAALGDDENFSTTVTNSLATKLPLSGGTMTGDLILDSSNAEINLKSGITDTSGAINWTFNSTGTNYASIKLPYNTRATTGLHIDSGYPITIDATTRIDFDISGTTYATLDSNGNLTLSGTVDGVDIAARDGVLTTTTNTANAALPKAGGTMTGNLTVSKTDPLIRLYDSNTGTGTYPAIEFDTANNQGVAIELNEFDSELPVAGYGLVVTGSSTNNQFPSTSTLSFNVLGEIYAGATSLGSLNKVFHDGYHPNADTLTTARTINGVSFNGSANITVADSTKLPLAGGTMTGHLTLNGGTALLYDADGSPLIQQNSGATYVGSTGRSTLRLATGSSGNLYHRDLSTDYRIFTDNYHPNADAWTTARTLSLTGDVTGSVSWDGSGNASLSATVANDSHTHNKIIATDDRDMKPSTSGITSGVKAIRPFFSTFGGMTGTSNSTYLDVLAFDTYSDSSGGGPSAITFHKGVSDGSPVMYIWKAGFGATTWGTGQRVFADNYHPNADALTTARTINGVSFDGSANITIADSTKLPLSGGTLTGALTVSSTITATGNIYSRNGDNSDIVIGEHPSYTNYGAVWLDGESDYRFLADPSGGHTFINALGSGHIYLRNDNGTLVEIPDTGGLLIGGNTAFHDGYHPNADKWTTSRTLTLSGDASGSVSWDGSGNATLSVTVADDSHDHTWANIDGETANSVNAWGGLRHQTNDGYIDFGPANTGWAHIYTDRPAFYFNKELYVNNNRVYNTAYHPEADKWTTARTLSLSGDASGSVSWDGSANATLSVAVADDSHNHDGRYYTESESDARFTSIDHFRHTGHGYYTSTTTSALLTEALGDDAFDSKLTAHKTGWSYSGNGNLTDAGRFTELAGTSWLWWTDNSTDNVQGNITALAIAPNTGGSAGKVFIYNYQGSSYSPGWREVWTSLSDGSGSGLDADLLDGVHGSSFGRTDSGVPDFQYGIQSNGLYLGNDGDTDGDYSVTLRTVNSSDTLYLQANVSGHVDISNSARSPIFYDSNNTTYYLDPSSTSDSALRVRGGALFGGNTTWDNFLMVGGDGRQNYVNNTNTASVVTTDGNLHLDAASGHATYLNYYDGDIVYFGSGSNSQVGRVTNAGVAQFASFTDNNDTAYYVNPNGTTNIADLDVNPTASSAVVNFGSATQVNYIDLQLNTNSGNAQIFKSGTNYSGFGGTSALNIYNSNANIDLFSNGRSSYDLRLSSGNTYAANSSRAPIFYDSDNTAYYVDAASDSKLNNLDTQSYVTVGGGANAASNNPYSSVTSTRLMFGSRDSNAQGAYFIGTNMENFGGNYTKLDLRWHTGIRMGAQATYGGVRIFDSEALGTRLFSVGEGDTNVRVSNSLYAGEIYDFDNTAYYTDPNSDSRISRLLVGDGSNYIRIGDEGEGANTSYSRIRTNSSGDLFLDAKGSQNIYLGWWSSTASRVFSEMGAQFPIYYDRNDTAFFVNPNNFSRLNRLYTGSTSNDFPLNTQFTNVLGGSNYSGRVVYFDAGANNSPSTWYGAGSAVYGAIDADQSNGLRLYYNSTSNVWSEQFRVSNGYAIAINQMRAPIFYDSSNTAYYAMPASTSVFNQINATTLNSTSDIRFKSDLQKIDNAVDKLKTISGYTYMLKDHDDRKAGLIAQEVAAVLPEAVKGSEDKKLLDYQATIALLVEAVKEQSEEIATLKSRLTKLEH